MSNELRANFPDDLWKQIKDDAEEIGVTVEKYVVEAVRYAIVAKKSGTMFGPQPVPRPPKKSARR
jgi:hypothetical protein